MTHTDHKLNILTWHVHGSYLYYLLQTPHQFFIPVKPGRPEGFGGLPKGSFPWPENAHEIPADQVRTVKIDAILFQSRRNYLEDQFEILSDEQRTLPRLYLEHDPPREHPTDTKHPVDDPNILMIHVTYFNDLMWDSGRTPTRVIEHGVIMPEAIHYSGELERGLVVVNGLASRGRRLGADIFEKVRQEIPLDLVGMKAEELGGKGEISHDQLPAFEAQYRFFFNPIRYTSLGLAVCEAMMLGLPVIGLATTEMATVVENGKTGYVDTNIHALMDCMKELLKNPSEAKRLGAGAQRVAQERFNIFRFASDWDATFRLAASNSTSQQTVTAQVNLSEGAGE